MLTFAILAVVMIAGAIGVVAFRQPVHAALSLVGTLLTLAVVYVQLQAHFLAAIQVIVYAGAIMVLFLFVIMLLNIQGDGPDPSPGLGWLRPAAYLVALLAAGGIGFVAFTDPRQLPAAEVIDAALQGGGAGRIGEALFSEFALAFQLVGVLLLTGIVGAVSLVQRRAETPAAPRPVAASSPAAAGGGRVGVATLERPGGASAPQRRDDLKRIRGIGPKLERLLNENGITRFAQIAALTPDEVRRLDAQLEAFQGRIERDDWVAQARRLDAERNG